MGQFISWIESNGKDYFLTDKDINSEKWKDVKTNPTPDFALSNEAVRQYHNLGSSDLNYQRNKNFWNGNIPPEIKEEWNCGNLDGMLKLIGQQDVENIVKNAPDEFSFWVVKNVFDNPDKLIKSNFWIYRLAGFLASGNYQAMTQDKESARLNFIGASILEDPELVLTSIERKLFKDEEENYKAIRLGTRKRYDTMMRDKKSSGMRLIAQSITKNYERMLDDYYPWARFAGIIGTIYDREDDLEIGRPRI